MKDLKSYLWGVFTIILMVILMLGSTLPIAAQSSTDENGTEAAPYTINSLEEFVAFRDAINDGTKLFKGKKLSKGGVQLYFKLTNDIDLSSVCHKVDGTEENDISWKPIGIYDFYNQQGSTMFMGHFDGNGQTISNLYINAPSLDCQGLFGNVGEGGEVKSINLLNTNVKGNIHVGSVVGTSIGTIISCNNNGNVTGNEVVGGVVGSNNNLISLCTNSGNVTGTTRVGGMAGTNHDDITSCTNSANITGTNVSIGGVVGINNQGAAITLCTNSGSVFGKDKIGGLVGLSSGDLTFV